MLLPNAEERAKLTADIYMFFRVIDDIIDGDTPHLIDTQTRIQLLDTVGTILENLAQQPSIKIIQKSTKNDLLNAFVQTITERSQQLHVTQNLVKWMKHITDSLLFDAKRIHIFYQKKSSNIEAIPEVYSYQELSNNFTWLDSIGTIFSTAELYGLDPEQTTSLVDPLWRACRCIYTVQDILSDPKQGIINIPKEDMERFDIDEYTIRQWMEVTTIADLPKQIIQWCHYHLHQANDYLDQYNKNMKNNTLKLNYSHNKILQLRSNIIMKKFIFPQGFIEEIRQVQKDWEGIH